MGYSIAIRVRSETQRLKFLKFMQMNFHHWSIVCGKPPSEWQGSASDPTDDLSYGDTRASIGFDYQSGVYGFERDYIYSVIRWMAIKVGDRKTKMLVDGDEEGNVIHEFSGPTPYYIYDVEKALNPVLVVTEEEAACFPTHQRHWSVDEWGVRIGPTAANHQIGSCTGLFGEIGAKILEELKTIGADPPRGKANARAWWKRRQGIYLKYLRPEIDESIGLIRQEIQLLDKLWLSVA